MRVHRIYPDWLDVSWCGKAGHDRRLVARYCSIYEHHANPTSHLNPIFWNDSIWDELGEGLAKV